MSKILLSKEAFFHNLTILSNKTGIDKMSIALKDNAYGHGIVEMAKLASEFGIKRVVVRNVAEASQIKGLFSSVITLAQLSFSCDLSGVEVVANTVADIEKLPENTRFYLKVDSGMHRFGVGFDELELALSLVAKRRLTLIGVLSHLRSADLLSTETFWQTKIFLEQKRTIVSFCEKNGLQRPLFSLHNSAGVFRSQDFSEFDFVRVGIAAYGLLDMPPVFEDFGLRPVMSLWGKKVGSREYKKGARVGYAGSYEFSQDCVASMYDVGYGDGFMRLNEGHSYILPDGKMAFGRVNMDSICIEGDSDEVCLFDDARRLARLTGTIAYDITTKLCSNIERIVV